eukprot:SAG31_NODE_7265_length_1738_cov_1.101281_1_plen_61_part_10
MDHGRCSTDNFVVFPYLDDVDAGDGGLMILPGRCAREPALLAGVVPAANSYYVHVPRALVA